MKKIALLMSAVFIGGVSLFAAEQKFTPAERRAHSISAAKTIATRNMMETISGQHLVSVAKMNGLDAGSFDSKINSKILGSKIRGMRYATQYDKKRDLAIVHVEVDVDDVVDLVPVWKNSPVRVIRRIGFSSTTPATIKKIQAIRAAEMDAYGLLLAEIKDIAIKSQTSVKNMSLVKDDIEAIVIGGIYGARMIIDPNDKDTITWSDSSDDASCEVTLELDMDCLTNKLGINVPAEKKIIRKKGIGLPNREKQTTVSPAAAPVKVVEKEKVVYVEKKVVVEREPATREVGSTLLNK